MIRLSSSLLAGALFLAPLAAFAVPQGTVADREGALRQDKAAHENDARWIYNDYERGFAEAKRQNKPLLVVLRCVPCKACMGIDAQVVLADSDLGPLLDKFVCVRVINANALDLARFQFDYDLSFSAIFFNGDGTVYGRYGSWKHQRDSQDQTTASFRRAMEGALKLHAGYPADRDSLAGKQPGPMPFKSPTEIPGLAGKYRTELDWGGKVVASCIHCHQIGDAIRTSLREQSKPMPEEWVFPFPPPETIGLTLDPETIATVQAVAPGSSAAGAGLQPGDNLVAFANQPLISAADLSWALHRAPASGELPVAIERGGKQSNVTLALSAGWRRKADISERHAAWPMRGMALGGLLLEDLPDAEREQQGLAKTSLALLVKNVGQYGMHAAAKNAGFLKGDIIVELDGFKDRATESEAIGRLMLNHARGEKVAITALRGKEKAALQLPMQ
jgi:hypothetical protein